MRIDVKKFLFMGLEEEKEAFFQRAQAAGIIHFINLQPSSHPEFPVDIQQTIQSIKILRQLPPLEQEENFASVEEPDALIAEILKLSQENEQQLEKMRVLNLEIARIDIFGDFSLEDLAYIEQTGPSKVQFFYAKATLFDGQPMYDGLIYVGSEHGLDYYMAVNAHSVHYEGMIEIKIEQPLGVLRSQYAQAQQKQHGVEQKLKTYAKYNDLLHHVLVNKFNNYDLYTAQTYVQQALGGNLFAVEGWVPASQLSQLDALTDEMHIYTEEIAIEPTDAVPTYLENQGVHRIGEDVIRIYDTPSTTDKDPSMWVLGSFTLFFAMIIGDAGYGLVYLALALFLHYKYPNLTGVSKRILNLFTILCVGCMVWGVLMNSFFGMQLSPDNSLRKFSLLQWLSEKKTAYHINAQDTFYQDWVAKHPELQQEKDPTAFLMYQTAEMKEQGQSPPILTRFNDHVLFELAMFIGVVHIILSLLRYMGRNPQGIGWIAFLIGAYLYFAHYLKVPSILNYVGGIDLAMGGQIGFQLMIGGIAFAWLVAIYRYGIMGIFEVVAVIQFFADVLSYLRLYALGLAGAVVSSTINDIASGLPLLLGVLLIVLSHFVNIVLSTMSGVIHGLRLNFIEWYHYSFEGGGKNFKPLKLLKIE